MNPLSASELRTADDALHSPRWYKRARGVLCTSTATKEAPKIDPLDQPIRPVAQSLDRPAHQMPSPRLDDAPSSNDASSAFSMFDYTTLTNAFSFEGSNGENTDQSFVKPKNREIYFGDGQLSEPHTKVELEHTSHVRPRKVH